MSAQRAHQLLLIGFILALMGWVGPFIWNPPSVGSAFAKATTPVPMEWTLQAGLDGAYVKTLLADGTDLFAGMDGPTNGIFRSTDQGQSWKPAGQGVLQTSYYAPLAFSGKNLFLGHFGSGVFRSSDEGSSWVAVNAGLKQSSVPYAHNK